MSTIRDEISGATLANEVRMQRAVHKGSFLLVEGGDDYRFFMRFVENHACKIIVCCGRENLIEATTILEDAGFRGAIGFADKDFSEFLGFPEHKGEIVISDETDIDVMILCSPALDAVLVEFGDEDRIGAAVAAEGRPAREILIHAAAPLGALRLLSQREGWHLKFEGMKYRFTDANSHQCNIEEAIKHVVGRSANRPGVTEREIKEAVCKLVEEVEDVRVLLCGHDCIRVLGRALRRKFGRTSKFNNDEGAETLAGVLRVAYTLMDFASTAAFRKIRAWEGRSGYRVLA